MKYILLLIICLTGSFASAQLDRRLAHPARPEISTAKPEKIDIPALATKKLKEDLALDAFQEAVILDLLRKNQEAEEKLIQEDLPRDAKIEKVTVQRGKLNEKIKEVLTPEQREKFEKSLKKKK